MKFTSKLFFFIISISILSCQSNEVLFEDAICIQNISTIDPTDGLKDNQTIILKDGKIHKIADTSTLALSIENNIIDGTGKYMIPGLWDAHVHFAYIEEMAPSMFKRSRYRRQD